MTQTNYQISQKDVTVTEAEQITVANTLMSHLNTYVSNDRYNGSFALTTATKNAAIDHVCFEVDASGKIQSKSGYDLDFDTGQTSFDMDVVYTHFYGVTIYTDRLSIVLTNQYSDDHDIVLASVDVITAGGAREAMVSIGSVTDRMSTTHTIICSKKNQLISNLQRLSAVLTQTHIARGLIFDANKAKEAAGLAK